MVPKIKIPTNTNTTRDKYHGDVDSKKSSHDGLSSPVGDNKCLNHDDYNKAYVANEESLVLGYFILFLSKNSDFQISDDKMSDFIENCKAANPFKNYDINIQANDIIKTRVFKQLAESLLFKLQEDDAEIITTFKELANNLLFKQLQTVDDIRTIANTVISQAPNIIEFAKKLLNIRIPQEAQPACLPRTYTNLDKMKTTTPQQITTKKLEQPQTSCFSFFADLLFCCMGVERSQQ